MCAFLAGATITAATSCRSLRARSAQEFFVERGRGRVGGDVARVTVKGTDE
jgi:hypothetical protein